MANGCWKVFIPMALLVLVGCDRWSSTSLHNDLPEPARLHLHYQWKGGELVKRRMPGGAGSDGYVWTTLTPEGEMRFCARPVMALDSGEVVDEVQHEVLERWERMEACVDGLTTMDAYVLHLTLAPGESLHLARGFGLVSGHYMDSLLLEVGPDCYRMRSPEAISTAIEKEGGAEFSARVSRIRQEAELCDPR